MQLPFYTKSLRNVEGVALNISVYQNCVIIIAPPTGHTKSDKKKHCNVMPRLLLADTGTKFGMHICHEQTHKKPSWTHTVSPTGSRPLWCEMPFYASFENYLVLEIKHHSLVWLPVSSGWGYDDDTVLMHRYIQGDSLYIPERFGVEGELYVEVTRTWCFMAKDLNWPHYHSQEVWRRQKLLTGFHLQGLRMILMTVKSVLNALEDVITVRGLEIFQYLKL